jgi:Na+-translocating ferredoxin:NAD+ oxidoreductase RnfC subunit
MKLRHISAHNLVTRLELNKYDVKASWTDRELIPSKVSIPLQQHIGTPSVPLVRTGDMVIKEQLIATIPEGKTGASIHASISGTVIEVNSKEIIIHPS